MAIIAEKRIIIDIFFVRKIILNHLKKHHDTPVAQFSNVRTSVQHSGILNPVNNTTLK